MASTVARRYAQAVFEIARQSQTYDLWERDLATLNAVVADPVTSGFLKSPKVGESEKRALLDKALEDGQPEARRLAALLLERRRIDSVPGIFEEYGSLVLEEKGIVIANVTTAVPLDSEGEQLIQQRLSQLVGKDVQLQTHVDPAIIGGLVARIGDNLIDGSVANQLRRLHERLSVSGI